MKKFLSFLLVVLSVLFALSFSSFAASKVTVTLSASSYTYNGEVNTPSVTVKNSSGTKLKKNTDYTLSYSSGRKNVGKYTVKVTLKGKYSGTVSKTYKIIPKGTSITQTTPSTTSVKVDVKKQSTQTSGYQVQYSTSSDFASPEYKSSTSTSISPSALNLNKKYYLRVRTYKKVNGENFYSKWSTASNTTTKIPTYKSSAYVKLNGNKATFKTDEIKKKSFEKYSKLDKLGRCGVAVASVGKDIMPTEARGSIGQVKPTGWHTVKYDCVSGKYLYNRCHLIAFELAGENANEKNLITGTRYMNINGMLPFENMVHDYVKETSKHVMYRVTPIFKGNDLLARGVQIEAYSVEDKGKSISFNVFCFNVQPGITINYSNGDSSLNTAKPTETKPSEPVTETTTQQTSKTVYITSTGTKYHLVGCRYLKDPIYTISVTEAKSKGYTECSVCKA